MSFGFGQVFNGYRTAAAPSGPQVVNYDSTVATGSDCGSLYSIVFPTTPANGNFIIIGTTNNIGTLSAPTGFTELLGSSAAGQVFYKRAGASETNSYDFTYLGSSKNDLMVLSGVVISGVLGIDDPHRSSNTRNAGGITTSFNNEMIFIFGGGLTGTDFVTQPSGYTSIISQSASGATSSANVNMCYKMMPTAGAEGTASYNTGSYTNSQVFTLGLIPTQSSPFTAETSNTTGKFVVPVGVTSLQIEIWGGGGGGGGQSSAESTPGGGGGGGGYSSKSSISVSAGTVVSYAVGAGGAGGAPNTNGSSGSNSTASIVSPAVSMAANGASPGVSGDVAPGGNGGSASGGTTNTTGTNGSSGSGAGGVGGAGASGGAGGSSGTSSSNGAAGTAPGGGGQGGGGSGSYSGGAGAKGRVTITW